MYSILHKLIENPGFIEGEHWQRLAFPTNDVIIYEGDPGRKLYLVLKGRARITARLQLEDGRNIKPGFFELGEGEFFGEMALFDHHPHSATVTALLDCELAAIDGEKMMAFLEQHPDLGFQVLREIAAILVQRIRATNKKMFSIFAWGLKAHGIENHL